MNTSKLEQVMEHLDGWVSKNGNGQYIEDDTFPSDWGITDDWGIQQVRKEIMEFVALLVEREEAGTILEIGLGYYGSTHVLWRQLFSRVITIEKSHDRIRNFGKNTKAFYNDWILDDGKSQFLIGYSNEVSTIQKAYGYVTEPIDVLFIDGDHSYEAVLSDWLLYSPMVKSGGIVAFHDSVLNIPNSYYGVPKLLGKLGNGEIDSKVRDIKQIVHSKNVGIAYYIKD